MSGRGYRYVGASVLALSVLAGCSGHDTTAQGEVPPVGPATVDETTGGIEGTVFDAEYRELVGAGVAILGLDMETQTGEGGRFSLSNVPPGAKPLAAQKVGYVSQVQSVDVVAGQVSRVEFLLAPIPVPHPWTETLHHVGIIGLGVAYVRSATCLECGNNATSWFTFGGFPDDYAGVVVEAEWLTQDYLGFDLNQRGDDSKIWYRTRSQSPVHYFVERCGDYTGPPHYGRDAMPCTENETRATQGATADYGHLETWYMGQFQDLTHALDPVCQAPTPYWPGYAAGCYGLGVASDLRWETWFSIFHMELPENAESFTVFSEG